MAIGIAQFCRYHDLKFICVLDPKATRLNVAILKALGATISLVTEPDPVTGDFLVARLNRVRELLGRIENGFWSDQYRNPSNARAHHRTMGEIVRALDGKIDVLLCATSTCGTIRGCVDFVRDHGLPTTVYAVDAVGSVIFGGKSAKRLIPGHGAGIRPGLYRPDLAEHCIHVTDMECVIGCRRLAHKEAILAGGSSGALVMALDSIKHALRPGSNCVLILPDRGERYLDTIFSDEWVAEHFRNSAELAELRQPDV
jgi:2,3-diaminopropionate biosynthesis protein SbnA